MITNTSADNNYGRSDYAPRDPIEVVYSTHNGTFSYVARSRLIKNGRLIPHIRFIPIRRGEREVDVVVTWMADPMRGYRDEEVDRVVKLPKRVWLKRYLGASFEELFLSRE